MAMYNQGRIMDSKQVTTTTEIALKRYLTSLNTLLGSSFPISPSSAIATGSDDAVKCIGPGILFLAFPCT